MLDGQEKTLDVSQIDCRPSPSKQRKALDGLGPSPSKQQKTLDGFLKRPSNSTSMEEGMPSPSTKQRKTLDGLGPSP
jgi:SWI/SNF-related matrix-associated actin-dependent regulator 1 of chromatin subfamily A